MSSSRPTASRAVDPGPNTSRSATSSGSAVRNVTTRLSTSGPVLAGELDLGLGLEPTFAPIDPRLIEHALPGIGRQPRKLPHHCPRISVIAPAALRAHKRHALRQTLGQANFPRVAVAVILKVDEVGDVPPHRQPNASPSLNTLRSTKNGSVASARSSDGSRTTPPAVIVAVTTALACRRPPAAPATTRLATNSRPAGRSTTTRCW